MSASTIPTTDEPTPQQQLVRDMDAVYGPLDDAVPEIRRLVAFARGLAHHETAGDDEEEGEYAYMVRRLEEVVDELMDAIWSLPDPRAIEGEVIEGNPDHDGDHGRGEQVRDET